MRLNVIGTKTTKIKKDFQKMRTDYDTKISLILSSNTNKHENQRQELKICKI
jgi:hypothetical protein